MLNTMTWDSPVSRSDRAEQRQRVEVRRATGQLPVDAATGQTSPAELEADILRVKAFAKLMDAQFEIGGVKVGVDTLIGLIPVVGDTISSLIALYPVSVAKKHGLGKIVRWRMMANIAADWAVGLIPFVGDVADIGLKSNLRNAKLLEEAAARKLGRPITQPTEHPVEGRDL
jgi:hypothetical protein